MITRRTFVATLAGGMRVGPLATEAQRRAKVWRIAYLDRGSAARDKVYLDAFRQGLRDLGWLEGQNIVIDARFAEGKPEQLPALAAELAAREGRPHGDVVHAGGARGYGRTR